MSRRLDFYAENRMYRATRWISCAMSVMLAVAVLSVMPRTLSAQLSHDTGMEMDRVIRTFVLAERLEFLPNPSERPVSVDLMSWIGGDYRRLYLRVEGEQSTVEQGGGEWKVDALMGRLISPYFSAVAGVRLDTRPTPARTLISSLGDRTVLPAQRATRGLLGVGLVGLAPGWFEVEPMVYVSDEGDLSLEFESSFDLLLTQRLILQPRVEFSAALQEVPRLGIGSGLNDVEFGARMRYEMHRKFAPYVGATWHRLTGATAAMADNVGEPKSVGTLVAGVRIWR